jgi:hypothetical protein
MQRSELAIVPMSSTWPSENDHRTTDGWINFLIHDAAMNRAEINYSPFGYGRLELYAQYVAFASHER